MDSQTQALDATQQAQQPPISIDPKNATQECKFCKNSISQTVFYCPICGKKLREPPLSTGIIKQLGVYAISVLLPPLGLIPAVKYLLSKEKHAKIIGIIALILTIISTVITLMYSAILLNQITSQLNQFNDLQNLGY